MLTAAVLLCALVPLTRASDSASVAWSDFNGRSYIFVPENFTWALAEKNCVSMNSNLVSVHSAEESEFIQNLIESAAKGSPRVWIGGSDSQENNVWFWSDGTPFIFTRWSPRQPDNLFGLQSCIQTNHGETLGWDDSDCSNERSSVCAKKILKGCQ